MAKKLKNSIQDGYVSDEGYEQYECIKDGMVFWITETPEGLICDVESIYSNDLIYQFKKSKFGYYDFKINEDILDETGSIFITFKISGISNIDSLKSDFLGIKDFSIIKKWESQNDCFPYTQYKLDFKGTEFIVTTQEIDCKFTGQYNHILYCTVLNDAEELFGKLLDAGYDVNNIEIDTDEYVNSGFINLNFNIDYNLDLEDLVGKIKEP